MSKICISFYNALYNENDLSIMPCWYESFFDELRRLGNELLVFPISKFQIDYKLIDAKIKEKILGFNPNLYITFNNVFFDMDFLECPIIIYEADTPIYWSNKERLKKNKERYTYAVFGNSEKKEIENMGIPSKQIFIIRPFTSVKANASVKPDINISFIGSRFAVNRKNEIGFLENEPPIAIQEYMRCLMFVINNPSTNIDEVIEVNKVSNPMVKKMVDIPGMLMMMSAEQRVRTLSAIVDLGLSLYGTKTWLSKYHFDSRLNVAFVDEKIYSLRHNETIYNRSKIGINCSHYQAKDSFSWRVLDIMASNACLVTDRWSGTKTRFSLIPIPTYENEYEAREICKILLNDEERRKEIVKKCQEIVNLEYRFENHLVELETMSNVRLCD